MPASQTAHSIATDTYLFAPAELDWFRHAPTAVKPEVEVVFDVEAERAASDRPWWRNILDELS